jgi:hypothetical protein
MSAYIISQANIKRIVESFRIYGHSYGLDMRFTDDSGEVIDIHAHTTDGLNKVGQILTDGNYKSVNYRYNENEQPEIYEHDHTAKRFTPVQLLKACACYEYQACEVPDFKNTLAYRMISRIKEAAINALPGYKEAEWLS